MVGYAMRSATGLGIGLLVRRGGAGGLSRGGDRLAVGHL